MRLFLLIPFSHSLYIIGLFISENKKPFLTGKCCTPFFCEFSVSFLYVLFFLMSTWTNFSTDNSSHCLPQLFLCLVWDCEIAPFWVHMFMWVFSFDSLKWDSGLRLVFSHHLTCTHTSIQQKLFSCWRKHLKPTLICLLVLAGLNWSTHLTSGRPSKSRKPSLAGLSCCFQQGETSISWQVSFSSVVGCSCLKLSFYCPQICI